jgi:anti-sigma factor RsiW
MPLHEQGRTTRNDSSVELLEVQHADVRSQLSDALDGSLPATDAARVADHLETCGSCRAFARTLERTIALVRELPPHELPRGARQRLLERIDRE